MKCVPLMLLHRSFWDWSKFPKPQNNFLCNKLEKNFQEFLQALKKLLSSLPPSHPKALSSSLLCYLLMMDKNRSNLATQTSLVCSLKVEVISKMLFG